MSARVVVLERDEELRTDYRNALEDEGYEVRTVTDAGGVVSAISEGWPEVAVVNLALPGIDGIELLWEIAKLDRPVPLVISALPLTGSEDVLAWVAEGFVSDSVSTTDVRHIIGRVPAKRQAAQHVDVRPRPNGMQA